MESGPRKGRWRWTWSSSPGCYKVADDFLPTIETLLARSPRPDHIVVETSGLALPKPLVKALAWPEVKARLTVDGVIALVDGPAAAAGRFAEEPPPADASPAAEHESPLAEVFEDQLACADLVIVNKRDAMSAADVARVEALILEHARAGRGGGIHGESAPAPVTVDGEEQPHRQEAPGLIQPSQR